MPSRTAIDQPFPPRPISDCLIRNDRAEAGAWLALKAIGGQGNMIVDNLLGGPIDVEPNTAACAGNMTP
jgi:hypothetical protein